MNNVRGELFSTPLKRGCIRAEALGLHQSSYQVVFRRQQCVLPIMLLYVCMHVDCVVYFFHNFHWKAFWAFSWFIDNFFGPRALFHWTPNVTNCICIRTQWTFVMKWNSLFFLRVWWNLSSKNGWNDSVQLYKFATNYWTRTKVANNFWFTYLIITPSMLGARLVA